MWFLSLLLSCEAVTDFRFTQPDALELIGECASRDDAVPLYEDADGDTYGNDLLVAQGCLPVDGWVDRGGDCADDAPEVHSGHGELCNGIDDNCNYAVDEAPELLWCADKDEDGYGDPEDGVHACDRPDGYIEDCDDCDDRDDTVNPEAAEVPGDDADNDCDGGVDE